MQATFVLRQNSGWCLIGSGYHSGRNARVSAIPGVKNIPFLNVDARFDSKMLGWLKQTMDSLQPDGTAKKPILLLTHHQPMSSFEHAFKKPAEQLAQLGILNGQEFVWLYGHEHRLTVYKLQAIANSLRAYPRCIGHGGMQLKSPN